MRQDPNHHIDVTIIGGGLTGLATAWFLKKKGLSVRLVEREPRTGGVIRTIEQGGFVFETGPNTGLASNHELIGLLEDVADSCRVEYAREESRKRYIWKKNRWHALPSGPLSGLRTPLFSVRDKLGILLEPFRRPGKDPMESVATMVRRRLGSSYLDYAVDPFVSGVYAGDPEYLVTKFALPRLYQLEQDYGSFIVGALRKARERKARGEEKPHGKIFSCSGGLGELTKALHSKLGDQIIHTGCDALRIEPLDQGYKVGFRKSGQQVEWTSGWTVLCTGAKSIHEILPFIPEENLHGISRLEYAKVIQVAAGFKTWSGMPLDAYGGLIPSVEKRNALGILFPSSIFDQRAPENGVLLSVFLGGFRCPEMLTLDDREIEDIVLKEIRETLGLADPKPDLMSIHRYESAIPQYGISSAERYRDIETIEREYPGLILAGNIRDGIGMADRVRQASETAERIAKKVG